MDILKYTENFKEVYVEHTCTHNIDSVINILL